MKKLFMFLLLLFASAFSGAAEISAWIDSAVFTVLDENGEPFDHPADSTVAYLGNGNPLTLRVDSTHPWKVAEIIASIKTTERIDFVEYKIDAMLAEFYEFNKRDNIVNIDSGIVTIHFLLTDKNLDTDEGTGSVDVITLFFEELATRLYIRVQIVEKGN